MTGAEKYQFARATVLAIWAVTQFTGTEQHAKLIAKTAIDDMKEQDKVES